MERSQGSVIPFPIQQRRAVSAQEHAGFLMPVAQVPPRPHSAVNARRDDEDYDDDWTMLSEESYRLTPEEYRDRPLPPIPLEARMRQTIHKHKLRIEPMIGSKSPTKVIGRFTEKLSRRLAKECVTCMERIDGADFRASCGHFYDEQCLDQLFLAASQDEALFPPTCCGKRISLASARDHLSSSTLASFEEKRREFSSQRRVYCAKASCSRFLSVQYDSRRLTMNAPRLRCPNAGCGTVTCMRCKLEVQDGVHHRCDKDVEDVDALELGEQYGWARCPGCEAMIELNQGCYHMTCRCKMEFCYLCKRKWKGCSCPQWQEDRLTDGNDLNEQNLDRLDLRTTI